MINKPNTNPWPPLTNEEYERQFFYAIRTWLIRRLKGKHNKTFQTQDYIDTCHSFYSQTLKGSMPEMEEEIAVSQLGSCPDVKWIGGDTWEFVDD